MPIFNASQKPVDYLHLHYDDAVPDHPDYKPRAHEWRDGQTLPPLGMIKPPIFFGIDSEIPTGLDFDAGLIPVEVFVHEDDRTSSNLRFNLLKNDDEDLSRKRISAARESVAARFVGPGHPTGHLSFVTDQCYFVYGTAGDDAEDAELLAQARFDAQKLWSRYNISPMLKTDDDLRDGNMLSEDF
ncbi:MAG TPA: hypothetical protein EYP98_06495, partial [Planctomycetes bacterium]|nr:hypothetical protein [Planctomycetota bacterium]